jgi:hypothetical protein
MAEKMQGPERRSFELLVKELGSVSIDNDVPLPFWSRFKKMILAVMLRVFWRGG